MSASPTFCNRNPQIKSEFIYFKEFLTLLFRASLLVPVRESVKSYSDGVSKTKVLSERNFCRKAASGKPSLGRELEQVGLPHFLCPAALDFFAGIDRNVFPSRLQNFISEIIAFFSIWRFIKVNTISIVIFMQIDRQ